MPIPELAPCEVCGALPDNHIQSLAYIRFRRSLCETHYRGALADSAHQSQVAKLNELQAAVPASSVGTGTVGERAPHQTAVEHVTAILAPFFPGWAPEEMEGVVHSIVFAVRKYDANPKKR